VADFLLVAGSLSSFSVRRLNGGKKSPLESARAPGRNGPGNGGFRISGIDRGETGHHEREQTEASRPGAEKNAS
jgi:hypothetical protein